MKAAPEDAASAVVRRPRDRKRQIADTAARLFCERGYHRVGVDDVAAEVGITGGAIYRHFGNKADLLARTVSDAFDSVDEALAGIGDDADVAEVIGGLARLAVERRHLALLLDREARHLPPDELERHLRRASASAAGLEEGVRHARPELASDDVELLVRATLAVLASPAYHRVTVPPGPAESLLASMANAVVATTALPQPAADAGPARALPPRASRREALLAAATTLFARNGYAAVTMEEIGAAAGISGTSIYQHFPGKADLLAAAFTRGAEWLQFGLSQALGTATAPAESLEAVVRSYVDFVLAHLDLMGLLLTEAVHLPEAEIRVLRRTQHDYVTEWVDVVLRARPDLSESEAQFRTHAALAIVNDAARAGRPTPQPSTANGLAALALEAVMA